MTQSREHPVLLYLVFIECILKIYLFLKDIKLISFSVFFNNFDIKNYFN
jgi:hypothetical protein